MSSTPLRFLQFITFTFGLLLFFSGAQANEAAHLTWEAPTANEDGSPITDLAGYRLYYWQMNDLTPRSIDVGSQTAYTIEALQAGQEYHFVVTAYDLAGNESASSNELRITIASAPLAAAFSGAPLAGPAPLTVTFIDASDGRVTAWEWHFGDGASSTEQHPIHFYNTPGAYTVSLTVSGPEGTDTVTQTAYITVTEPSNSNTPPVANDDAATTAEDTSVTISNVIMNDTDAEGGTLSLVSFTQPIQGTVVSAGDETFTYTPHADFHGTDSFAYIVSDQGGLTDTATVTVTVAAVNDAPIAVADTASTTPGAPVTVAVLANDTDVDSVTLTVRAVTQGSQGTVAINADDSIHYTPVASFQGADAFTYTVSDGDGGTATGMVTISASDSETVQVWLEAEAGYLQSPMVVQGDELASSGQYIEVPEKFADLMDSALAGGVAEYHFEVPESNFYVIWGRVKPNTFGKASFFLGVDTNSANTGAIHDVSPARYEVTTWTVGDSCYVEYPKGRHITALPTMLTGLVGIKTAYADRRSANSVQLTFGLDQAASLYVAYDARVRRYPDWLRTLYTDTGEHVETSTGLMRVWQRDVAAGAIVVPGNRYGNPRGYSRNYMVFVDFHSQAGEPEQFVTWQLSAPTALTGASGAVSEVSPVSSEVSTFQEASSTWQWDQAALDTMPIFFLAAGSHILQIKQRESGSKLDKLLITTDMETVPQD